MVKEKCSVDPSKYVILDVETNGLSSIRDDLLSISIYKPDTGDTFNRFLPLELNSEVVTTHINGIKTEDLKGLLPLSQEEVDSIVQVFDLKNRTILTYGTIDEKFVVKYFQRHRLQGIDYFTFYNFKHEIISSRFSGGNITKDNLCNMYGIENVQHVHSGSNDCILEWKLFERMNGHRLLITNNKVFEFNSEYIVPASYITTYPNLKYYLPDLPKINCESRIVFSLPVPGNEVNKFPTNFNGMIIEHLINTMLDVKKIHSEKELLENKKKLNYLGTLPSTIDIVPTIFNPDGSVTATRPQDQKLVKSINSTIQTLKKRFNPLINFIGNTIFEGQEIKSQELVIQPDKKVLALCDLSNERAVLEIKASTLQHVQSFAEQLYYESNGRNCFILLTDWSRFPGVVSYNIYKVSFSVKEITDPKLRRFQEAKKKIQTDDIELLSFVDAKNPVKLRCKRCGNEWNMSYYLAQKHRPCPHCTPKESFPKVKCEKPVLIEERQPKEEQKIIQRFLQYKTKVEDISNNQLTVLTFKGAKNPAKIKCLACGHEWEYRADHLLDRAYCPLCKKHDEARNKTSPNPGTSTKSVLTNDIFFSIGDKVRYKGFGVGKIVKITPIDGDFLAMIRFNDATKWLRLRVAAMHMEKI